MDDVRFSAKQEAIANEIKELDRQLDELDEHMRKSIAWGLLGSGAGAGALARERSQQHDDDVRSGLQVRRRALADELRASVEGSRK